MLFSREEMTHDYQNWSKDCLYPCTHKDLRLCIFKTQPHLGDEGWRNHFILGPHISYDEPSHIMVINLSSRVPVFLDQNTLNLPISTILAYIQKRVVLV